LSADHFWVSAIIEAVGRSPDKLNLLERGSGIHLSEFELGAVLMIAAPSGWYDFERLNYCRMADECPCERLICLPGKSVRGSVTRRRAIGGTDQTLITCLIFPAPFLQQSPAPR